MATYVCHAVRTAHSLRSTNNGHLRLPRSPDCARTSLDQCLQENKFLDTYKQNMKLPALSMVDDVACVAQSGLDSIEVNAFINAKTNLKKLQFGIDKCHQLHVGDNEHLTPKLYIDNWEVKKVNETKSGVTKLMDVNSGKICVDQTDKDTYLGDILTNDGKNIKNILARKAKGYGIINKITSINTWKYLLWPFSN
jgi:hypothetical protein